jgi:hypothetical protein
MMRLLSDADRRNEPALSRLQGFSTHVDRRAFRRLGTPRPIYSGGMMISGGMPQLAKVAEAHDPDEPAEEGAK